MRCFTIHYTHGKVTKKFEASGKKIADAKKEFKRLMPEIPIKNIYLITILKY
jgi:hypothetical protein